MKLSRHHLPALATTLLVGLALLAGPIAQPADYHAFADRQTLFGLPHGFDVWSNLGFALVAIWGWLKLSPRRHEAGLVAGWPGHRLFLIALLFTAFGSTYYHLAPDNTRLVWDRLPIALACAGLLAGVRGNSLHRDARLATSALALFAVASVGWWQLTEQAGRGDLRPYLLLQLAPLFLLPLWQWIGNAPKAQRRAIGGALLLYAVAKLAELYDHQIAAFASPLTGHTLKHLLAAAAAAAVIGALGRKPDQEPDRNCNARSNDMQISSARLTSGF